MHLGVVHPRLEARGRPFPRSPRSRSRVNLHVLRPLTRGPQGQPSPLRTPHGCPGVQGIFLTSPGQGPHGWSMVHHSMATGSPIRRGCCSVFSAAPPTPLRSPATSLSLVPRLVIHLFLLPAPLVLPFPWGRCVVLATGPSLSRRLLPYSGAFTPPGCQQPCSAGPLNPLPSRGPFRAPSTGLSLPAPSVPCATSLHPSEPILRAQRLPMLPGCCAALATRPSLSRPLFRSSRVFSPAGRRQPLGAGPLDPHPSGDCLVRLARVAFPSPFRVGGVLLS